MIKIYYFGCIQKPHTYDFNKFAMVLSKQKIS